ncbi:hypothetical protein SNE40_023408 [Patella caerulea]|uniref:SOCS box domain-containing protein n=1 Tax=Patella caerulea TaxID=87958 RepID=A0AAN8G349_PATCE
MCEDILAEGVALELRKGGHLDDINQLFVIHEPTNIVKWLHPDLSINLFQLSILYNRFDVFQYLLLRYPAFLDYYPTYQASNQYRDIENEKLLLNAPLHLACLVGNIEMVRYILVNKSPGTLSHVSLINLTYEADQRSMKEWKKVKRMDVQMGKPFEFSITSGNIECMDYLLTNHIIQCLALRFLYAGVREPSSLLHKACSIGSVPMIQILLDRSFKDVLSLCDKNGKTPLHIACWNGDTRSLCLLLENGASVNCMTESRNCLHILYRSKLHPYNYKPNTQVLLDYGIDFHAVDKNGKSALHILSEEIGISRVDVMCYWKKASEAITDMTVTSSSNTSYTVDTYQNDLLSCLELLLQKGIDPNMMSHKSGGNQTPVEVLLQYSSLPYSCATLWLNPEVVYDALKLLMQYGANPNFESRVTNMTLFNQFLVNHLADIRVDMREKFINLFCQYGANPNIPLSPLDYPVYPILSVMECLPNLETTKIVLDYMSLSMYQKVLSLIPSQVIPRLIVNKENHFRDHSRNLHFNSQNSGDLQDEAFWEYVGNLKQLVRNGRMRSLKHVCKLDILKCLGRKGYLVGKLPLPNVMKNYLESSSF